MKIGRDKFAVDSGIGYFVGTAMRSSVYLIANADGIFKVRTARRMTEDQAYTKDCLEDAKVSFRDYARDGASTVLKDSAHGTTGGAVALPPQPLHRDYAPRRVRRRREDIAKLGATRGCPGCLWIETGIGGKTNTVMNAGRGSKS